MRLSFFLYPRKSVVFWLNYPRKSVVNAGFYPRKSVVNAGFYPRKSVFSQKGMNKLKGINGTKDYKTAKTLER